MENLINSFATQRSKIQTSGCIWVEGKDGWYHTYDKKIVRARISEIDAEIARLEEKQEASK